MKTKNWLYGVGLVLMSFLLFASGCATQQGAQGAGLGAIVGGVSGALIDRGNPFRGAAIGGGLGAVLGGGLGEIAGSSQNYNPPPQQGYYPPPRRGYYYAPPPPPPRGYYYYR
ncbi:MAG: hypothetical protein HY892_11865 [Deltaproteobacteria bacterium]|nr:hypothetical protein [Deltaproteobacteria bacterium]